jgi:putative transcriptional regulator
MKSRIGEHIDKSGYKKKHIAQLMEVSPTQISNWVSGKSYPSVPKLYRLAKLLGVKADDLFTGDEDED